MTESRVVIEVEQVLNTCFVVMPFHALFEAEYEKVIRPAVEATGLTCVRGDEIYSRQAIVQDIWASLRQARLVLAELSGRNPNVMYEIGLAHALGKPILLITRSEDDVPFDLRALRYIYYDQNNPFWGTALRDDLTRLIRTVLEKSSTAAHLDGIRVETTPPAIPSQPARSPRTAGPQYDLSGSWYASWLSIKLQLEHQATLVIPVGHGNDFTASMVVTYHRGVEQTIVQETLTGSVREAGVSLTGVSYTYVQQGQSITYTLDSFELRPSDEGNSLVGKALLANGVRDVTFVRQAEPAPRSRKS